MTHRTEQRAWRAVNPPNIATATPFQQMSSNLNTTTRALDASGLLSLYSKLNVLPLLLYCSTAVLFGIKTHKVPVAQIQNLFTFEKGMGTDPHTTVS